MANKRAIVRHKEQAMCTSFEVPTRNAGLACYGHFVSLIKIFREQMRKMALIDRTHATQALAFDRTNKSLRKGHSLTIGQVRDK